MTFGEGEPVGGDQGRRRWMGGAALPNLGTGAMDVDKLDGGDIGPEGSFPGSEYTNDERDFLTAMDRYQRKNRRKFPAFTEVLAVAEAVGYRRVAAPQGVPSYPIRRAEAPAVAPATLAGSKRAVELVKVMQTLAKHDGNITHAARELGISRQALHMKLRQMRKQ